MFQSVKVLPRICYCESLEESKIDVKYVPTVKSTTSWVRVKSNRMFGTKHPKTNRKTRPSNTKQMNRLKNLRIEIWK